MNIHSCFSSFIFQGVRQLEDFDISEEAGGVERATTKHYNVNVTENHLEIHLFWAGRAPAAHPYKAIMDQSFQH